MKSLRHVPGKCAGHWNMMQKYQEMQLQSRKYHSKVLNELCTCCMYTNSWPAGSQKYDIYKKEEGMYKLVFEI